MDEEQPMDWRDVARERKIPLWEGAKVRHALLGRERDDLVTHAQDDGDGLHLRVASYLTDFYLERDDDRWNLIHLRLDDPDTQPAYLRRLAVRSGCPESVAGELVGFVRYERWTVVAGPADEDGNHVWFQPVAERDTDDRLLALALAWPKG